MKSVEVFDNTKISMIVQDILVIWKCIDIIEYKYNIFVVIGVFFL